MLATYSKRLSDSFSHQARCLVRDYGPRLTGVRIDPAFRARDHWKLDGRQGEMHSCSSYGAVAGKGAHLLIIDDLIRDNIEAANPDLRDKLWTWINSELMTRLEPDGKVLCVMSRRHPDDCVGRMYATNADLTHEQQWHTCRMPAISDEGLPLWPERFPLEKLREIKNWYESTGQGYLWDCLYMQDPRGDSTMTEWLDSYWEGIEYEELPPSLPVRMRVLALDPSKGKNARRGDFASFSDVILDQQLNLWVTPTMLRVPTSEIEDQAVAMLRVTRYDAFGVEINGFQEVLADNIVKKAQGHKEGPIHCPLIKLESTEDKVVRIRMDLTSMLSRKKVRINARSPHARLFLGQFKSFPSGSHDDGPDSLSLGVRTINQLLTGRQQPQQPKRYAT